MIFYETDGCGVHHQVGEIEPMVYDTKYVADRYDTYPEYKVRGMSYLRLGYMAAVIPGLLAPCPAGAARSVLDVGYGNGKFLEVCAQAGLAARGYDVSGYRLANPAIETFGPLEDGALPPEFFLPYDVVTFYDSLEHFQSLEFLEKMQAEHIVVSAPWCHFNPTEPEFWEWKHRRPGEHLHHFSPATLADLMAQYDYGLVDMVHAEDAIRQSLSELPNIFTATFRRLFRR